MKRQHNCERLRKTKGDWTVQWWPPLAPPLRGGEEGTLVQGPSWAASECEACEEPCLRKEEGSNQSTINSAMLSRLCKIMLRSWPSTGKERNLQFAQRLAQLVRFSWSHTQADALWRFVTFHVNWKQWKKTTVSEETIHGMSFGNTNWRHKWRLGGDGRLDTAGQKMGVVYKRWQIWLLRGRFENSKK